MAKKIVSKKSEHQAKLAAMKVTKDSLPERVAALENMVADIRAVVDGLKKDKQGKGS